MLYHRDCFWQNSFYNRMRKDLMNEEYMVLSSHLEHYFFDKTRSHEINRNKLIDCVGNIFYNRRWHELFEVEIIDGHVVKAVIRTNYNRDEDICIVFRKNLVVTAWLNDRHDKHSSLDKSKYYNRVNNFLHFLFLPYNTTKNVFQFSLQKIISKKA